MCMPSGGNTQTYVGIGFSDESVRDANICSVPRADVCIPQTTRADGRRRD